MTDPYMRITRTNINDQIREQLAARGIAGTVGTTGGRLMWTIDGEQLTPGEAADKYLPGGFAGNFGKA